jgi:hypothetical protein
MAFNFDAAMAGLFEATQNFTGLAMKSALEKEATAQSIKLQGEVGMQRLEKEQTYDREKTDKTLSQAKEEGALDRGSREKVAEIGKSATLGAASISASTQRFINQQNIEAQVERDKLQRLHTSTENQLQRDATEERDKTAQANAVKLQGKAFTDADGNLWSTNPSDPDKPAKPVLNEKGEQLNGRDPETSRALGLTVTANSNLIRDLTAIYTPQLSKLDEMEKSVLAKAGDAVTAKEKAAHAETLKEIRDRREALQNRFDEERKPLIDQANNLADFLSRKGTKGAVAPGGSTTKPDKKDLKDIITVPGAKGKSGELSPLIQNPYEPYRPPSGLINYG